MQLIVETYINIYTKRTLQVHLYTSMYTSGIVSLHYSMIGFIRCEWNQSNKSLPLRESDFIKE